MQKDKHIFSLILGLVEHKAALLFWYAVRFFSALLPLYTIYLFGQAIKLLENHASLNHIVRHLLFILFIRLFDNLTRLLSIHRLEYYIQQTELSLHQFLIYGLKTKTKDQRHQIIQAVRNFGEAVRTTLYIIRQPGIDGLVSFFTVPIILFFLDFRIFVLDIAYIATYCVLDVYTTQRYSKLKNSQNAHVETYYAKLQDSNNVAKEHQSFLFHLKKLCRWGFIEWILLQNTAVCFYFLIFFYLSYTVFTGQKQISDLVLIMGYIANTQTFLNHLSGIKDRLADCKAALSRLAANGSLLSPPQGWV